MQMSQTIRQALNKASESFGLWLSGALVSALAATFLVTDSSLLDWRFKFRYLLQPAWQAHSDLVVLALFTKKAREAGVTPRDHLANLIQTVSRYHPAVIALDYEFLAEDRSDPHFTALQTAITRAGNVVLPCLLLKLSGKYEISSKPPEELTAGAGVGYATLFDETVHDMILETVLADSSVVPSFALASVAGYRHPQKYFPQPHGFDSDSTNAAAAFDFLDFSKVDWDSVLQSLDYPVAGVDRLPVNYYGPVDRNHFRLFRDEEFLKAAKDGAILPEWIQGKIVLIGSTYPLADGSDQFDTPFGKMQGVEVHASIINTLLSQAYLKRLGMGWTIFFSAVSFAIAALSLLRLRLAAAATATAAYLFIYLLAGFVLFARLGLILPLAFPLKTGIFGFLAIYYWQQYSFRQRKTRRFLDFEILLEGDSQPNRYYLRLINAPTQAGDAKAEVIFEKNAEFERSLKRLQRGYVDQNFLQIFGYYLYRHLFVDDLATSYHRSLTQARLRGKGLRLRLRIDAPELRLIPWEYLYDKRYRFFFSANPQILLTRYVESSQPRRNLRVKALNILIVISNPEPASLWKLALPPIDAAYEKNLIVSALDQLSDRTNIPIRYIILEHAVAEEIRRHLSEAHHVFHFIGHSTYRDGAGKIVLENAEHEAVFADEAEFSDLFLGHDDMRLVILNSCKSAATSALPEVSGLAYRIIERGVPAVIAMQYAIEDDAAIRFSREFYRTLAGGHPVDLAMAQARLALAQNLQDTRPHDFGIPVLFMRAKDGRIV